MRKLILTNGVDVGNNEGTGFNILKDEKLITLSEEEAKKLCKELAKTLDCEVIERHRLKFFDDKEKEPTNLKYIGKANKNSTKEKPLGV